MWVSEEKVAYFREHRTRETREERGRRKIEKEGQKEEKVGREL